MHQRLVSRVIERMCPRWFPGGIVLHGGNADGRSISNARAVLNIEVAAPEKMPDVVVHDQRRGWLVLVEAVTSAGPVDAKRRQELRALFANATAGLVFVTAFTTRDAMRSFLSSISWETEVWIASDPDHLIHFNGERYLGPYPD